jgi:CBS-domain-containing membrane protein
VTLGAALRPARALHRVPLMTHVKPLSERRVAELMSPTPVLTFTVDDAALFAVRRFVDEGVDSAPVVGGEGRVLGVLSAKDCLGASLAVGFHPGAGERRVGDMLSAPAEVLQDDDTLQHALAVFATRPRRLYPVVDDHDRLVGVLRRQRLLSAYLDALEGYKQEAVHQDGRDRISRTTMSFVGPATNWWFLTRDP